jgi:hypothetical protein
MSEIAKTAGVERPLLPEGIPEAGIRICHGDHLRLIGTRGLCGETLRAKTKSWIAPADVRFVTIVTQWQFCSIIDGRTLRIAASVLKGRLLAHVEELSLRVVNKKLLKAKYDNQPIGR